MSAKKSKQEQEIVQQRVFSNWINHHVPNCIESNLVEELRDGRKLIALIHALTGAKLPEERGPELKKIHRICNVQAALDFLQKNGLELVNIRAADIVDGNARLILGLVWTIILRFNIDEFMRLWHLETKENHDAYDHSFIPAQHRARLGAVATKEVTSTSGGPGETVEVFESESSGDGYRIREKRTVTTNVVTVKKTVVTGADGSSVVTSSQSTAEPGTTVTTIYTEPIEVTEGDAKGSITFEKKVIKVSEKVINVPQEAQTGEQKDWQTITFEVQQPIDIPSQSEETEKQTKRLMFLAFISSVNNWINANQMKIIISDDVSHIDEVSELINTKEVECETLKNQLQVKFSEIDENLKATLIHEYTVCLEKIEFWEATLNDIRFRWTNYAKAKDALTAWFTQTEQLLNKEYNVTLKTANSELKSLREYFADTDRNEAILNQFITEVNNLLETLPTTHLKKVRQTLKEFEAKYQIITTKTANIKLLKFEFDLLEVEVQNLLRNIETNAKSIYDNVRKMEELAITLSFNYKDETLLERVNKLKNVFYSKKVIVFEKKKPKIVRWVNEVTTSKLSKAKSERDIQFLKRELLEHRAIITEPTLLRQVHQIYAKLIVLEVEVSRVVLIHDAVEKVATLKEIASEDEDFKEKISHFEKVVTEWKAIVDIQTDIQRWLSKQTEHVDLATLQAKEDQLLELIKRFKNSETLLKTFASTTAVSEISNELNNHLRKLQDKIEFNENHIRQEMTEFIIAVETWINSNTMDKMIYDVTDVDEVLQVLTEKQIELKEKVATIDETLKQRLLGECESNLKAIEDWDQAMTVIIQFWEDYKTSKLELEKWIQASEQLLAKEIDSNTEAAKQHFIVLQEYFTEKNNVILNNFLDNSENIFKTLPEELQRSLLEIQEKLESQFLEITNRRAQIILIKYAFDFIEIDFKVKMIDENLNEKLILDDLKKMQDLADKLFKDFDDQTLLDKVDERKKDLRTKKELDLLEQKISQFLVTLKTWLSKNQISVIITDVSNVDDVLELLIEKQNECKKLEESLNNNFVNVSEELKQRLTSQSSYLKLIQVWHKEVNDAITFWTQFKISKTQLELTIKTAEEYLNKQIDFTSENARNEFNVTKEYFLKLQSESETILTQFITSSNNVYVTLSETLQKQLRDYREKLEVYFREITTQRVSTTLLIIEFKLIEVEFKNKLNDENFNETLITRDLQKLEELALRLSQNFNDNSFLQQIVKLRTDFNNQKVVIIEKKKATVVNWLNQITTTKLTETTTEKDIEILKQKLIEQRERITDQVLLRQVNEVYAVTLIREIEIVRIVYIVDLEERIKVLKELKIEDKATKDRIVQLEKVVKEWKVIIEKKSKLQEWLKITSTNVDTKVLKRKQNEIHILIDRLRRSEKFLLNYISETTVTEIRVELERYAKDIQHLIDLKENKRKEEVVKQYLISIETWITENKIEKIIFEVTDVDEILKIFVSKQNELKNKIAIINEQLKQELTTESDRYLKLIEEYNKTITLQIDYLKKYNVSKNALENWISTAEALLAKVVDYTKPNARTHFVLLKKYFENKEEYEAILKQFLVDSENVVKSLPEEQRKLIQEVEKKLQSRYIEITTWQAHFTLITLEFHLIEVDFKSKISEESFDEKIVLEYLRQMEELGNKLVQIFSDNSLIEKVTEFKKDLETKKQLHQVEQKISEFLLHLKLWLNDNRVNEVIRDVTNVDKVLVVLVNKQNECQKLKDSLLFNFANISEELKQRFTAQSSYVKMIDEWNQEISEAIRLWNVYNASKVTVITSITSAEQLLNKTITTNNELNALKQYFVQYEQESKAILIQFINDSTNVFKTLRDEQQKQFREITKMLESRFREFTTQEIAVKLIKIEFNLVETEFKNKITAEEFDEVTLLNYLEKLQKLAVTLQTYTTQTRHADDTSLLEQVNKLRIKFNETKVLVFERKQSKVIEWINEVATLKLKEEITEEEIKSLKQQLIEYKLVITEPKILKQVNEVYVKIILREIEVTRVVLIVDIEDKIKILKDISSDDKTTKDRIVHIETIVNEWKEIVNVLSELQVWLRNTPTNVEVTVLKVKHKEILHLIDRFHKSEQLLKSLIAEVTVNELRFQLERYAKDVQDLIAVKENVAKQQAVHEYFTSIQTWITENKVEKIIVQVSNVDEVLRLLIEKQNEFKNKTAIVIEELKQHLTSEIDVYIKSIEDYNIVINLTIDYWRSYKKSKNEIENWITTAEALLTKVVDFTKPSAKKHLTILKQYFEDKSEIQTVLNQFLTDSDTLTNIVQEEHRKTLIEIKQNYHSRFFDITTRQAHIAIIKFEYHVIQHEFKVKISETTFNETIVFEYIKRLEELANKLHKFNDDSLLEKLIESKKDFESKKELVLIEQTTTEFLNSLQVWVNENRLEVIITDVSNVDDVLQLLISKQNEMKKLQEQLIITFANVSEELKQRLSTQSVYVKLIEEWNVQINQSIILFKQYKVSKEALETSVKTVEELLSKLTDVSQENAKTDFNALKKYVTELRESETVLIQFISDSQNVHQLLSKELQVKFQALQVKLESKFKEIVTRQAPNKLIKIEFDFLVIEFRNTLNSETFDETLILNDLQKLEQLAVRLQQTFNDKTLLEEIKKLKIDFKEKQVLVIEEKQTKIVERLTEITSVTLKEINTETDIELVKQELIEYKKLITDPVVLRQVNEVYVVIVLREIEITHFVTIVDAEERIKQLKEIEVQNEETREKIIHFETIVKDWKVINESKTTVQEWLRETSTNVDLNVLKTKQTEILQIIERFNKSEQTLITLVSEVTITELRVELERYTKQIQDLIALKENEHKKEVVINYLVTVENWITENKYENIIFQVTDVDEVLRVLISKQNELKNKLAVIDEGMKQQITVEYERYIKSVEEYNQNITLIVQHFGKFKTSRTSLENWIATAESLLAKATDSSKPGARKHLLVMKQYFEDQNEIETVIKQFLIDFENVLNILSEQQKNSFIEVKQTLETRFLEITTRQAPIVLIKFEFYFIETDFKVKVSDKSFSESVILDDLLKLEELANKLSQLFNDNSLIERLNERKKDFKAKKELDFLEKKMSEYFVSLNTWLENNRIEVIIQNITNVDDVLHVLTTKRNEFGKFSEQLTVIFANVTEDLKQRLSTQSADFKIIEERNKELTETITVFEVYQKSKEELENLIITAEELLNKTVLTETEIVVLKEYFVRIQSESEKLLVQFENTSQNVSQILSEELLKQLRESKQTFEVQIREIITHQVPVKLTTIEFEIVLNEFNKKINDENFDEKLILIELQKLEELANRVSQNFNEKSLLEKINELKVEFNEKKVEVYEKKETEIINRVSEVTTTTIKEIKSENEIQNLKKELVEYIEFITEPELKKQVKENYAKIIIREIEIIRIVYIVDAEETIKKLKEIEVEDKVTQERIVQIEKVVNEWKTVTEVKTTLNEWLDSKPDHVDLNTLKAKQEQILQLIANFNKSEQSLKTVVSDVTVNELRVELKVISERYQKEIDDLIALNEIVRKKGIQEFVKHVETWIVQNKVEKIIVNVSNVDEVMRILVNKQNELKLKITNIDEDKKQQLIREREKYLKTVDEWEKQVTVVIIQWRKYKKSKVTLENWIKTAEHLLTKQFDANRDYEADFNVLKEFFVNDSNLNIVLKQFLIDHETVSKTLQVEQQNVLQEIRRKYESHFIEIITRQAPYLLITFEFSLIEHQLKKGDESLTEVIVLEKIQKLEQLANELVQAFNNDSLVERVNECKKDFELQKATDLLQKEINDNFTKLENWINHNTLQIIITDVSNVDLILEVFHTKQVEFQNLVEELNTSLRNLQNFENFNAELKARYLNEFEYSFKLTEVWNKMITETTTFWEEYKSSKEVLEVAIKTAEELLKKTIDVNDQNSRKEVNVLKDFVDQQNETILNRFKIAFENVSKMLPDEKQDIIRQIYRKVETRYLTSTQQVSVKVITFEFQLLEIEFKKKINDVTFNEALLVDYLQKLEILANKSQQFKDVSLRVTLIELKKVFKTKKTTEVHKQEIQKVKSEIELQIVELTKQIESISIQSRTEETKDSKTLLKEITEKVEILRQRITELNKQSVEVNVQVIDFSEFEKQVTKINELIEVKQKEQIDHFVVDVVEVKLKESKTLDDFKKLREELLRYKEITKEPELIIKLHEVNVKITLVEIETVRIVTITEAEKKIEEFKQFEIKDEALKQKIEKFEKEFLVEWKTIVNTKNVVQEFLTVDVKNADLKTLQEKEKEVLELITKFERSEKVLRIYASETVINELRTELNVLKIHYSQQVQYLITIKEIETLHVTTITELETKIEQYKQLQIKDVTIKEKISFLENDVLLEWKTIVESKNSLQEWLRNEAKNSDSATLQVKEVEVLQLIVKLKHIEKHLRIFVDESIIEALKTEIRVMKDHYNQQLNDLVSFAVIERSNLITEAEHKLAELRKQKIEHEGVKQRLDYLENEVLKEWKAVVELKFILQEWLNNDSDKSHWNLESLQEHEQEVLQLIIRFENSEPYIRTLASDKAIDLLRKELNVLRLNYSRTVQSFIILSQIEQFRVKSITAAKNKLAELLKQAAEHETVRVRVEYLLTKVVVEWETIVESRKNLEEWFKNESKKSDLISLQAKENELIILIERFNIIERDLRTFAAESIIDDLRSKLEVLGNQYTQQVQYLIIVFDIEKVHVDSIEQAEKKIEELKQLSHTNEAIQSLIVRFENEFLNEWKFIVETKNVLQEFVLKESKGSDLNTLQLKEMQVLQLVAKFERSEKVLRTFASKIVINELHSELNWLKTTFAQHVKILTVISEIESVRVKSIIEAEKKIEQFKRLEIKNNEIAEKITFIETEILTQWKAIVNSKNVFQVWLFNEAKNADLNTLQTKENELLQLVVTFNRVEHILRTFVAESTIKALSSEIDTLINHYNHQLHDLISFSVIERSNSITEAETIIAELKIQSIEHEGVKQRIDYLESTVKEWRLIVDCKNTLEEWFKNETKIVDLNILREKQNQVLELVLRFESNESVLRTLASDVAITELRNEINNLKVIYTQKFQDLTAIIEIEQIRVVSIEEIIKKLAELKQKSIEDEVLKERIHFIETKVLKELTFIVNTKNVVEEWIKIDVNVSDLTSLQAKQNEVLQLIVKFNESERDLRTVVSEIVINELKAKLEEIKIQYDRRVQYLVTLTKIESIRVKSITDAMIKIEELKQLQIDDVTIIEKITHFEKVLKEWKFIVDQKDVLHQWIVNESKDSNLNTMQTKEKEFLQLIVRFKRIEVDLRTFVTDVTIDELRKELIVINNHYTQQLHDLITLSVIKRCYSITEAEAVIADLRSEKIEHEGVKQRIDYLENVVLKEWKVIVNNKIFYEQWLINESKNADLSALQTKEKEVSQLIVRLKDSESILIILATDAAISYLLEEIEILKDHYSQQVKDYITFTKIEENRVTSIDEIVNKIAELKKHEFENETVIKRLEYIEVTVVKEWKVIVHSKKVLEELLVDETTTFDLETIQKKENEISQLIDRFERIDKDLRIIAVDTTVDELRLQLEMIRKKYTQKVQYLVIVNKIETTRVTSIEEAIAKIEEFKQITIKDKVIDEKITYFEKEVLKEWKIIVEQKNILQNWLINESKNSDLNTLQPKEVEVLQLIVNFNRIETMLRTFVVESTITALRNELELLKNHYSQQLQDLVTISVIVRCNSITDAENILAELKKQPVQHERVKQRIEYLENVVLKEWKSVIVTKNELDLWSRTESKNADLETLKKKENEVTQLIVRFEKSQSSLIIFASDTAIAELSSELTALQNNYSRIVQEFIIVSEIESLRVTSIAEALLKIDEFRQVIVENQGITEKINHLQTVVTEWDSIIRTKIVLQELLINQSNNTDISALKDLENEISHLIESFEHIESDLKIFVSETVVVELRTELEVIKKHCSQQVQDLILLSEIEAYGAQSIREAELKIAELKKLTIEHEKVKQRIVYIETVVINEWKVIVYTKKSLQDYLADKAVDFAKTDFNELITKEKEVLQLIELLNEKEQILLTIALESVVEELKTSLNILSNDYAIAVKDLISLNENLKTKHETTLFLNSVEFWLSSNPIEAIVPEFGYSTEDVLSIVIIKQMECQKLKYELDAKLNNIEEDLKVRATIILKQLNAYDWDTIKNGIVSKYQPGRQIEQNLTAVISSQSHAEEHRDEKRIYSKLVTVYKKDISGDDFDNLLFGQETRPVDLRQHQLLQSRNIDEGSTASGPVKQRRLQIPPTPYQQQFLHPRSVDEVSISSGSAKQRQPQVCPPYRGETLTRDIKQILRTRNVNEASISFGSNVSVTQITIYTGTTLLQSRSSTAETEVQQGSYELPKVSLMQGTNRDLDEYVIVETLDAGGSQQKEVVEEQIKRLNINQYLEAETPKEENFEIVDISSAINLSSGESTILEERSYSSAVKFGSSSSSTRTVEEQHTIKKKIGENNNSADVKNNEATISTEIQSQSQTTESATTAVAEGEEQRQADMPARRGPFSIFRRAFRRAVPFQMLIFLFLVIASLVPSVDETYCG